uniref:Uncharacterized protein n=1 Tax=Trichuris muris TaxID=70415 RepID=A0A5S6Q780_TRIMR
MHTCSSSANSAEAAGGINFQLIVAQRGIASTVAPHRKKGPTELGNAKCRKRAQPRVEESDSAGWDKFVLKEPNRKSKWIKEGLRKTRRDVMP